MAKIKNLSDLGELYASNIHETKVQEVKEYNDVLLTDASVYLPESTAPKVGEGFGKDKEELAKGTGPEASDNFKKVDEKQDPGSSKKVMKKAPVTENEEKEKEGEGNEAGEENEKEEKKEKKNAHQADAAKQTQPKEKIQERVDSASKGTKYNKQSFTMSKSKFDKLYEDAINGVPFVKEQDDATPVAPADDTGADLGADMAPDAATDMGEEQPMSHTEIIDLLQKALDALKKHAGTEDAGTGMDTDAPEGSPEAGTPVMEEDDDDTMDEAVDAEDLGHAGVGSGAKSEQLKDGHKIHKVSTLKTAGAASEQGGPKGGDGTVNKAKDFDKGLQKPTGNNQVGNLKTNKGTDNAFQ